VALAMVAMIMFTTVVVMGFKTAGVDKTLEGLHKVIHEVRTEVKKNGDTHQ